MAGNEPFSKISPPLMGRGSVPLPSGYAYPSSHFHVRVYRVAFATRFLIAYHTGARPLAVATPAECPKAQCRNANAMRLTLPPVRAQKSSPWGKEETASSLKKKFQFPILEILLFLILYYLLTLFEYPYYNFLHKI